VAIVMFSLFEMIEQLNKAILNLYKSLKILSLTFPPSELLFYSVMKLWLTWQHIRKSNQSATTKRLRTDANYNIGDSEI